MQAAATNLGGVLRLSMSKLHEIAVSSETSRRAFDNASDDEADKLNKLLDMMVDQGEMRLTPREKSTGSTCGESDDGMDLFDRVLAARDVSELFSAPMMASAPSSCTDIVLHEQKKNKFSFNPMVSPKAMVGGSVEHQQRIVQFAAAAVGSCVSKKDPKLVLAEVDNIGLNFVCQSVAEHHEQNPGTGRKKRAAPKKAKKPGQAGKQIVPTQKALKAACTLKAGQVKAGSTGKAGGVKAPSTEEAGGAKTPKKKVAAPKLGHFTKEQKKERRRLISLAYKRGFREGKELGLSLEKRGEMARAAHKKAGEAYDAAE